MNALEQAMDGGLASTRVGGIHKIVVNEGATLQEFEAGNSPYNCIVVFAACARIPAVGKEWAQTFSTVKEESVDRLQE